MPARLGKSNELYKTDVKMADYYKYYKKVYLPKVKKESRDAVSAKMFSTIVYEYYEQCIQQVVLKNKTLRLNAHLGIIKMYKRKSTYSENHNSYPIDYNETLKLWENDEEAKNNKQIVRHLNRHSDGYVYFFKWVNTYARVKDKNFYSFKVTRTNKLFLAHTAKEINIDCFEIKKQILPTKPE